VDFAQNAQSLGAHAIRARTLPEVERALEEARRRDRTTVIVVEVDKEARVPGYGAWWDVPVAEVSAMDPVKKARAAYDEARKRERYFL